MKKIYPLLTILFIAFGFMNLYAQNNFWTFPEQYWIPGVEVDDLPTPTQPSHYVHAGIQDPYGDIVFYVLDDRVYDKNGLENGVLQFQYQSNSVTGYSESLIVPQPGNCHRYYIFQSGRIPS
jgi:hypothetical protein